MVAETFAIDTNDGAVIVNQALPASAQRHTPASVGGRDLATAFLRHSLAELGAGAS